MYNQEITSALRIKQASVKMSPIYRWPSLDHRCDFLLDIHRR